MIEDVLNRRNIMRAYNQVRSNNGSAGVDGISVKELYVYLIKEMERQGLLYVRYADDFSIYTKNESSAKKIGNNIYLFLKNKLKLPINLEKSGIRKPVNFTILGYSFVPTYVKGEKGKYQLVVSEKSWN